MDHAEYDRNRRQEDTHWWFAGRNRLVFDWLERYAPRDAQTLLDAGCGTGGMLHRIGNQWRAVGADLAPESMIHCRRRGLSRLARASLLALPFADHSFDIVLSLDVLYHRAVADDVAALRELGRCLKPGGLLLITVAAFNFLRSAHDDAVHTRERYTCSLLRARVAQAGLAVRRISYTYCLLSPLIWPAKLLGPRRAAPEDDNKHWKPTPRPFNAALEGVLALETVLLRAANMPLGSSIICAASKA